MKELNYQFRQRLSIVHKPNRRDPEKKPTDNQIEFDSSWTITLPRDADVVLKNACRDLEDYFSASMGISVRVTYEDEACGKQIVYAIDATLPEYSYRLTVTDEKVTLCGQNSRFAAQAGYFIEDLMNLDEAPVLDRQEITRTSLFNPRMIHSGYGLDMFPEEYLRHVAHAGISALLVFVKDVDMTPHGYQDFNDLCTRAAAWGLDVYAYSYLVNRRHPDDPDAEEFYENLYGRLFDRCPYFKGIIFVGESCEFPSKDRHTTGIIRKENIGPDGKPIASGISPGWWPCTDYPQWLNMVKKIIYKRRPDADIVFWTYNWGKVWANFRQQLVQAIPKDITLQATYEMCTYLERGGTLHFTTDYTLFFEGPGMYFSTEAIFARDSGLKLYSMTNTAGRTWDIGVIPYVPAPYQWMKRYEGMLKANRDFGLCGTMDGHHYGFTPSFISDLAKWAFYSPNVDLDGILHRLAARDFTAESADKVCDAYKEWSEGITHLISTNSDQNGPFRMGPAYPFILFENANIKIPSPFYAHFGGNKIVEPNYKTRPAKLESWTKFDIELAEFRKVVEHYDRGVAILEEILPTLPERKREDAERIVTLGRFIANTARTTVNVKEFVKRKQHLLDTHGEERNRMVDEMIEICRREEINATNCIPLVEFDSMLGYEPSMEYMSDREHLEWKLALLRDVIEKELPSYYEK
ncbi:MAG: hypothetical protein J6Q82_03055 [Clostridia bacterium]|nr:hypothetical protein [Clostridia bacterium]